MSVCEGRSPRRTVRFTRCPYPRRNPSTTEPGTIPKRCAAPCPAFVGNRGFKPSGVHWQLNTIGLGWSPGVPPGRRAIPAQREGQYAGQPDGITATGRFRGDRLPAGRSSLCPVGQPLHPGSGHFQHRHHAGGDSQRLLERGASQRVAGVCRRRGQGLRGGCRGMGAGDRSSTDSQQQRSSDTGLRYSRPSGVATE